MLKIWIQVVGIFILISKSILSHISAIYYYVMNEHNYILVLYMTIWYTFIFAL